MIETKMLTNEAAQNALDALYCILNIEGAATLGLERIHERCGRGPIKIYWAVQVGYGRVTPDGRLPVFGVQTEEEAQQLIVMACSRGMDGNMYARELVEEQTLENLVAFSDRLQKCWDYWQEAKAKRKTGS